MPIQSFSCDDTRELFETGANKRFANIVVPAARKLTLLHAAASVQSMRAPPGNDLKFYNDAWHVRINGQWRLIFKWGPAGPYDVLIDDPH